MSLPKLFIDLGHSVKWPGASGIKTEVAWVRGIWGHLEGMISRRAWSDVLLVPDAFPGDSSASQNLSRRIAWINDRSAPIDRLVSIHANSGPATARGVECVYDGGNAQEEAEARKLATIVSERTGMPLRGNRGALADTLTPRRSIGMVDKTRPLGILLEAGFVTNAKDMAINPKTIAAAIAEYLNQINVPQTPVPPKPMPSKNTIVPGKILVAVEDRGRKYMINHEGKRVEIDKAPELEAKLRLKPTPSWGIFVSNTDLAKIPMA